MSEQPENGLSPSARRVPKRDDPPWVTLLWPESGGLGRPAHFHLVGIGGSGLSAIAGFLLERGYQVSGSDQRPNEMTDALAQRGVTVYRGHRAEHVGGADIVLVSSAVPEGNPEVDAAKSAGIPVVKRAQLLGPLMRGQHGIGIAGTHGKTTTTSMIAIVLLRAGLDPSIIVGGRLSLGPAEGMAAFANISSRAGKGPFVIEADEYDGMFLGLELEVGVVTNVEWDHVDCYPTPAAFAEAFRKFAGQIPPEGMLVVCADDPGALDVRDAAVEGARVETYGLAEGADWQARSLSPNAQGGFDAEVWHGNTHVADLSLPVPGRHNVRNALAALAVANWHHIRPQLAAKMLRDFHGAGRRFEFIGEAGGVIIIDDYAHHPTEVAATLSAARLRYPTRRIWAVFQPHTYSRTQALLRDYQHSFVEADRVLLLDIYAAREKIDLGMHSRQLLDVIEHEGAQYAGSIDSAVETLLANVEPDDIVITMSAGDGNLVGARLLAGLRQREGLV
ncbi:MAG: UDP-N-acetylmuramate--L-alanine ligase [Nitrososphaerales archaeon]